MSQKHRIVVGELNGRNGADVPLAVPDDQAVEMLNVDRWDGMLGRKRGGCDTVAITGGTAFASGIQSLASHVPGADDTARELWAVDGAGTVKRLAAGTSWADVTLTATVLQGSYAQWAFASLNGKLFIAADTTGDRLHCYDPNLAAPAIRPAGLAPGASAPTVANTGGGAYAAVLRYYRVRWLQMNSAVVVRRSEATPTVSFTPSGAGTAARVTRPAAPGEGETHWELEGSNDNANWFVVFGVARTSQVVIATTTADDTNSPTTDYPTFPASDVTGFYALFPSVKSLVTDGNRLLGAGAWESTGTISGGKNSRVWFTPVLGSADKGDDERSPNQTNLKTYLDLNENDGGGVTGLGVLNGIPVAFKSRQIYRLMPTGDVTVPYIPRKLIDGVGCVAHKSITVGEDEVGRPVLYFMSHKGPYRLALSQAGFVLQYLGRDLEDLTVNLGASTVVAHSVYYPMKHQWWLWIATGSSNDPDTLLVFDPLLGEPDKDGRIRKGWFKWSGNLAGARCSCLMANTLGASMSRDLKPYIGRATGTTILKADTSATDDAGTTFQAYVKTKPLAVAPLGVNGGVSDALLQAETAAGVTITLTLDRDYGAETRTSTVLLTATASETRTLKRFEASALTQAYAVQAQIGDAAAVANSWVLDALVLPTTTQESR